MELDVVLTADKKKILVFKNNDFLIIEKFIYKIVESLNNSSMISIINIDKQNNLANIYISNNILRFTEDTIYISLKIISINIR